MATPARSRRQQEPTFDRLNLANRTARRQIALKIVACQTPEVGDELTFDLCGPPKVAPAWY